MAKRRTKILKKKVKYTPEQKAQNLLKRTQENEIRTIFKNLGFNRIPNVDGKQIVYKERTTEMDDIFVCENVVLITEYTISKKNNDHLKDKLHFYNKVLDSEREFLEFIKDESKLSGFNKYFDEHIKSKYSINQLKVKIIYCSRFEISEEVKNLAKGIVLLEYPLVQYFKSLTKVIKRTGRYEFFDFIKIKNEEFGDNILDSDLDSKNKYSGHILPEEKSSFKEGFKIVSFYIDADSLMRRSYVLRQEGWRESGNIGYYQRMFEGKKISDMRKYLSEKKRVFINNIIATISEEKIKLYDEKGGELNIDDNGQFVNSSQTKVAPAQIEINNECNIIGLIDGQHRTYAYHEGDDQYETELKSLRKIQNLLVTGIIFPKSEKKENRLKFEANLFLEINSNQTNVRSQLKQEIELMINPFSTVAIAKRILIKLNENGPLQNLIEQNTFDKGKIKTASIVSFGLKPLIKLDDEKSKDNTYYYWKNSEKSKLKLKDSDEFDLLNEYIGYCVEQIRELLIAVKRSLPNEKWCTYSSKTPDGVLNVTFINGILNVLRFLIENDKVDSNSVYSEKLEKGFAEFKFKEFKSSQYRKMGEEIYNEFFK